MTARGGNVSGVAPVTRIDIAALLEAAEAAPPVEAPEAAARFLADAVGADDVALLLADLSGKALVRLTGNGGGGGEGSDTLAIAGTPQGDALTRQEIVVDGTALYAPVSNRGETIGVLEMRLPEPPDETIQAEIGNVARALGMIVVANRRYTDLFEWGQRSRPLSLAAEIQRRLLPHAYTLEAGQATIAGWLQPAAEVAGDTFDFSLERGTLHLSITDAMGHAVGASLLATTVVGALRNARRGGASLAEQAEAADASLERSLPLEGFVTGQIVRVDLGDGAMRLVNAGHPAPRLLRRGTVERLRLAADVPFGALPGRGFRVHEVRLEPGDRLFFITDGMLERNAAAFDLEAHMERTADEHARDAVQLLMHALLDATGDELQDDAAVLCVDWHGGGSSQRG